jgi:hypothetical protein
MTMVCRRDPVDRVVDLIVAVPVSIAAALREIVPVDTRRLERAVSRNLGLIGRYAARGGRSAGVPAASPAPDRVAAQVRRSEPDVDPTPVQHVEGDDTLDDASADLPIAGYDQLSARQIVDRLDDLTPAELAHVEAYERANRRRQTVLGRIGQLS